MLLLLLSFFALLSEGFSEKRSRVTTEAPVHYGALVYHAREMYGSGAIRSQGVHTPTRDHRPGLPNLLLGPPRVTPKTPQPAGEPRAKGGGSVYDPEDREEFNPRRKDIPPLVFESPDGDHPSDPHTNEKMLASEDLDEEGGVEGCEGWCRNGEFLCQMTCTCVPVSWRCDGVGDCVGGEDEMLCSLPTPQLACPPDTHIRCPHNAKCIKKDFICDGSDDCGDFSDETHCGSSLNCTDREFECTNGLCVPNSWVCDGDNDCRDYSDESNCTMKLECTVDREFKCSDGSCISLSWRCDGELDCSDLSDEEDCPAVVVPKCGKDEMRCAYPRCVRKDFRCDGDDDCGDWSDEDDCPKVSGGVCGETEFRCESGKCISESWRCDGERDCVSGEDEEHCDPSPRRECNQEEFACRNGNCILKLWQCDGVRDCAEGEDEKGCVSPCDPDTQFACPPYNSTAPNAISHCIRKKLVCDSRRDCPGGEDEWNCPRPKNCSQSSVNCKHSCITTYDGRDACTCRPGYALAHDGVSCGDIDECSFKTGPVCSQLCNNTIGSYTCGCYGGYILRPDGATCKALGAPPTLLFANRIDIRQVSLNHRKYTYILRGLHNAIALDYHYKKGYIFWTDVSMDCISRARTNGTNITDITRWGLDAPGGIAVDWVHDLLFWTDSGTRRVEVSNLDGQIRHVLVSEDLEKPRAIVVHPGEAFVFWTDWGPKPKIERCEMDGSNRINLITESIQWPNGLCLDHTADRLYWADAKHHVIESCKLDGSGRRKVITKGLPHPFAVTMFEDAIYWTDWHTKSISTASKTTGSGFVTVHSGLHFPMDIHSYHPGRQPNYTNHCGPDHGGCSHLCLPNHHNFQCICPLGLKLTRNNRSCDTMTDQMLLFARKKDLRFRSLRPGTPNYDVVIPVEGIKSAIALAWHSATNTIFWTDSEASAISTARVNGTQQKTVIGNPLEKPTGLSLDWVTNKLYWIDSETRRIEAANLDGTMRILLIWRQLDVPRDITVDPINKLMYWSDWVEMGGKIERAGMDGSRRAVFLSENMGTPNGLAIDYSSSRIYWTDPKKNTIEFALLNGKGREVLLPQVPYPFGLALYKDTLIYTDWETNSIHTVDKLTGKHSNVLRTGLSGLMDVIVMEQARDSPVSSCQLQNGGCSHLCLLSPNPQGYLCSCPIGIKMQEDGKTCNRSPEKWLIVAHRKQIHQIPLDMEYVADLVLPLPTLTSAVSVDVDKLTGEIYWSDTSDDVILKGQPPHYGVAAVVSDGLDTPDGIALDSIGRHLYWTDAGTDSIQVCSLSDCEVLRRVLIWEDLDNPRGITLNYDMGCIFWTDWGANAKIEQANMDGQHRITLVTENLLWPNGLAIHKDRMYWTDAQRGTIETMPLGDLSNRTVLLNQLAHPYSLAIVDQYLYWTDWQTQAVHRSFKNGSNSMVILKNLDGLMDIRSVVRSENEMSNVCGSNNGGCSHMCLRTPKDFSCSCPTGILLKNDNKTCAAQPNGYLLFATHSALVRISLDTPEMWDVTLPIPGLQIPTGVDFHWAHHTIFYSDIQLGLVRSVNMSQLTQTSDILINLSRPTALAVDWIANNIYVADTEMRRIEVARLDGSSRKVIIPTTEQPSCLTLHPVKGYLYWADWGSVPKIEWSFLDGSSRRVIVEAELGFPNGLTIDYENNKLYWADEIKDRIEMTDLNGKNRVLVVSGAHAPYGLTVFGDYIYWTNWNVGMVERADAETGRDRLHLRGRVSRTMDLRSVGPARQKGHTPCAVQNGHCSHLCLYRGPKRGYLCACPDLPDKSCSLEPSRWVETMEEHEPEDVDNELDEGELGGSAEDRESRLPESSSTALIVTGLILCLVVMAVAGVIIALLYHRRKTRQKKYIYSGGRSILTFSNPNYSVSSSQGTNPGEELRLAKRSTIWSKFRFEKRQERVFAVHCESDRSGSAEVVSLIPVPPSPCPSPTPTNSVIEASTTSNC